MQINIDDIDRLRRRTGVSYRRAKEILEQAGGNLVEALIYLEENPEGPFGCLSERRRDLAGRTRQVFGRLHRTRVKVRVKDKILFELPVTVGAAGSLLFPRVAALGLVGIMLSGGSLEFKDAPPAAGSDEIKKIEGNSTPAS